jgi:DNA-binding NarL/FixJ family response regulator
MIRVGIADDHPEMRVALRLLLNLSAKVDVISEASDGQEAVGFAERHQPDVLVMDVQMPVLDGFAATKQIIELMLPTRVILISTRRGKYVVEQATAAGAKGFLPKDELATMLLPAIEMVFQGETVFVE